MKVSLNWIRFLNDKYHCAAEPAPSGVDALVEKIGAQLGAIEEVINLGERYKGIVIVKVISADKHPNADKLKVCLVDDGGAVKNVARDKNGHVEIVCGAPNVKAGQLVAWIPPGSVVPSTFDKDSFVIEKRQIRGIASNGMLASPKELALGDSHEGLLVIEGGVKPGTSFAKHFGLDDYVIDIENKMFTHRPDLFGQLGIAREIAGIQQQVFKSPTWYHENASILTDGRSNGLKLEVKNELSKLVPRFCAVAIKDVKVEESPAWLRVRLSSVGIRPINNIVDITNFIMLETAQPLHAYDYDKVKTGVLGVRLSKKGESLKLLGGKEIKLDKAAVVITDGHKSIGLGGIMGGADTEVDETTKNIILECANFDMNTTRKTAMAYGLFTDAATRFTKNQSPQQNMPVLAKAVDDIKQIAGGRVASKVIDIRHFKEPIIEVKTDTEFINQRLGLNLTSIEICKLLENVEFITASIKGKIGIQVPFWRTDIEIEEDIVEEVGRLYGYDKLPQQLPERTIAPAPKDDLLAFKSRLRQILAQFGANEALTYSFVPGNLLKKAGQDEKLAYKLSNALSPSLGYYRFSLLASLLDKVHSNIKLGFDKFALFEIGKGHDKEHKDKDGLPMEFELLSLIYTAASKTGPVGSPYYQAKQYLDDLTNSLGVKLSYSTIDKMPSAPLAQPYEQSRSAFVSVASTGKFLGIIGEFKAVVRQNLKLPEHTAGFEVDIEALAEAVPPTKGYKPLSRFPQTHQDLCLRTSINISYAKLTNY
jgi:phenylalanyl-tRNA synthetase beta chain